MSAIFDKMDEVYATLIKLGKRSIEEIPEQHRENVQKILDREQATS